MTQFDQLTVEFSLEWNVSDECYDCYYKASPVLIYNERKIE